MENQLSVVKEKSMGLGVKLNNKKFQVKEALKSRFLDENGEGFKDAGTIFWVIGIIVGLGLIIFLTPIGQAFLEKFVNKADLKVNGIFE